MAARLSVIIPVLNEAENLALGEAFPSALRDQLELIVVDGGSGDNSVQLAAQWADTVIESGPGRAKQMNAGAASAHGDYLLFLHADTRLPSQLDLFLKALRNRRPVWGFFQLRLRPGNMALMVVAQMMNWHSRLTSVASGEQCLFVDRQEFLIQGRFAELPLMEDIQFSKRLRRVARPMIWSDPVTTSSRRFLQNGIGKTIVLMGGLRLAYLLGVSPQYLHKLYYPERSQSDQ